MVSHEGYELDDDPARVDLDTVWRFLSTQAYWGRWRSREEFERQVAGAWRVVAAYDAATAALVGFSRAMSDGVGLAYLGDVYVDPAHRGHGLGHALVATMIDQGPGAAYRWLLHTDDAHSLYSAHGFAPPDRTLLERPARRPPDGHPPPR